MGKIKDLAIVGCGARGLHALECFYISLSRKRDSKYPTTTLFETRETLGTGLAWDPDQTGVNWSNISDRALEPLHGRPAFQIKDVHFPEFPSYLQWLDDVMDVQINEEKDTFSLRKVTGAYLVQRAQTIIEPLQSLDLLEVYNQRITAISKTDSIFSLTSQDGSTHEFQKVILSLGHLKTKVSDENKRFKDHAATEHLGFSDEPYSKQASQLYKHTKKVIIKGLGLAMIDVVRMIMENHNADYEQLENSIFLEYVGEKQVTIYPYSLDGLPMVPKPVGKIIDDYFDPTDAGSPEMLAQLKSDLDAGTIKDVEDILYRIAGVVMTVYNKFENPYGHHKLEFEEGKKLIVEWMKNPSIKHDHIIDTRMNIVDYMKLTCEMSYGQKAFSLDYTIGQVWRILQIDMYYLFSYELLPNSMVAEFIRINEMAKRYSFGPPVDSILQLIALNEAGVLNLDYVNDPTINLIPNGFEISNKKQSAECDSLIDSVLAKPNLDEIDDPLISSLLEKPLAEQFEKNLGIKVSKSANHVLGSVAIEGLYSIGRNTKGSAHGVDAILECFETEKMQAVIDDIMSPMK